MVGSLENLLIFTVSPDIGDTSSITSGKYHLGYILTEHLFFLRRTIL